MLSGLLEGRIRFRPYAVTQLLDLSGWNMEVYQGLPHHVKAGWAGRQASILTVLSPPLSAGGVPLPGSVFDTEYGLRRAGGAYRWYLRHSVLLRNEEGRITAGSARPPILRN
jgi:hypothetical protein